MSKSDTNRMCNNNTFPRYYCNGKATFMTMSRFLSFNALLHVRLKQSYDKQNLTPVAIPFEIY